MTRITVNMTGESDTSFYAAPVTTALAAIHFTVDNLAKSIHNFMRGGLDATSTGTPTFSSTGAIFTDNVSYLETNVQDTDNMTIFVIGKLVSAGTTGAMLFGNHGASGSGFGMSLFMTSATSIGFGATRYNAGGGTNTSAQAVISTNTNTSWGLYVCEAKSTGNFLRNVTNGLSGQNTTLGNRVLLNAKCRIGANYSTTYDGQTNILSVVAHNASLTEAEIQKWIVKLRKYAASRGITV